MACTFCRYSSNSTIEFSGPPEMRSASDGGENQPHARNVKVPISFKTLDHDETARNIIVEANDIMHAGIVLTDQNKQ
jgi:hypothetical protein